MEDVGKLRYLIVEKNGRRKLKRPVPKDIQQLIGQKNFIRRIAATTAGDIKSEAHLFAVFTDHEISRHRELLNAGKPTESVTTLALSVVQADQVAALYFADKDRLNIEKGRYFADRQDVDFPELLSDASGEAEDALREATGEHRTSPTKAVAILAEYGVLSNAAAGAILKNGWPYELAEHKQFQYFCRLIEQADLALAERKYASLNLGSLAAVEHPTFGAQSSHTVLAGNHRAASRSICDLKELFLAVKSDSVGRSRAAQFRLPFRAIEEHFGSTRAVAEIGRDEARELTAFLPTIPAHATKRFPGVSLKEAATLFQQAVGHSAARYTEAEKHLRVISVAFEMAMREGWIDRNPFAGLRISVPRMLTKKHVQAQDTYSPFSIDQLNRLFALPLFVGSQDDGHRCHTPGPLVIRRHRYWAPIIALWTGMRMNEILQLEKADVCVSDGGSHYFHVTDEDHQDYPDAGFSKRLKNTNSLRKVPIHQALISLGFVAWVADRLDGRLFPEAQLGTGEKPSDMYSKRFRTNAKQANVWVSRKFVFHSFRNTFNDALRAANVPLEFREAIQGWRRQTSMDTRYGTGYSVQQLSDAVNLVKYPGLTIGGFTF